jgi:hypothetical protein
MVNKTIGVSDIWYFLVAFLLLCICQLLVLLIPFRWYIRLFESHRKDYEKSTHERTLIVRKALLRGLNYIPWNAKCLVQALTGKALLNILHLKGTICLGVTRENSSLTAHAWLKSGNQFICGQKGYEKFTVVREIN